MASLEDNEKEPLFNDEFCVDVDIDYHRFENKAEYFKDINFYESTPGGRPINRNLGEWFIITQNTAITPEITSQLEHYHMIEFQNYELPIENIPKHITHIKIYGKTYKHSINNLPDHILLFHMILYSKYMFPIENLPSNLKILCIDTALEYPIYSFPTGLLTLALSKYINHEVNIDIPPNVINFFAHIDSMKQVPTVPYNLKSFYIFVSTEEQFEPIIFHTGLLSFSLFNIEISPSQIEALPDSVDNMHIQITDDLREFEFIKFPKSLTSLSLEDFSFMNYRNILPQMINLTHIIIPYAYIFKIDFNNLPSKLSIIEFTYRSIIEYAVDMGGIFYTTTQLLELVNTIPEFRKYKNELEYCTGHSRKRTSETFDEPDEPNFDDDDKHEFGELYNYLGLDTITIADSKYDDKRTLKIKLNIVCRYLVYLHNMLISKNIKLHYY